MKEIYIPVEQFEGLTSISFAGYGKPMPTEPKNDEPITTGKAPDAPTSSDQNKKEAQAAREAATATQVSSRRKQFEEKMQEKGITLTDEEREKIEALLKKGVALTPGAIESFIRLLGKSDEGKLSDKRKLEEEEKLEELARVQNEQKNRQGNQDASQIGNELLAQMLGQNPEELEAILKDSAGHINPNISNELRKQVENNRERAEAARRIPGSEGMDRFAYDIGELAYSGANPDIQEVHRKLVEAAARSGGQVGHLDLVDAASKLELRGMNDAAFAQEASEFYGAVKRAEAAELKAAEEQYHREQQEGFGAVVESLQGQQGLTKEQIAALPETERWRYLQGQESRGRREEVNDKNERYFFTADRIINHHLAVILDKKINTDSREFTDAPREQHANEEQKRESYKQLLRYVKILYDNATDEDNHLTTLSKDQVGKLKELLEEYMPNSTYTLEDAKKHIRKSDVEIKELTPDKIRENAEALASGGRVDLANYFGNGLIERKEEQGSLPNSIEETMDRIMEREGGDFATGGKYELVDVFGDIRIENFLQWVRYRAHRLHEDNPNDQINTLSGINIQLQFTQLSLYDIIYTPRYLQTRKIRIEDAGSGGHTTVLTGEQTHKDFESIRETALIEAWLFGVAHTNDAAYRQNSGSVENWMKMMDSFCRRNDFTNSERLIQLFKLSGTDKQEYLAYSKNEGQGEVGKVMQRIMLQYNYLMEFAWSGNEKAAFGEKNGEEDNKFYEVLGGRKSERARAFHYSLAAQALNREAAAKAVYKEFVKSKIQEWASRSENAEFKTLSDRKINQVDTNDKYSEINFDSMSALYDLEIEAKQAKLNGRTLSRDARLKIKDKIREALMDEGGIDGFMAMLQRKYAGLENTVISASDISKFSNHEDFGVTLITKAFGIKRQNLNVFESAEKSFEIKKAMETAIAKAASYGNDVEDNEVDYAKMWMRTLVNWTGIAAKNEYQGIGFDSWSRIINSGSHLMRAKGRSGLAIEELAEDHPPLKHIGMTLWEALWVKTKENEEYNTTLIDFLQGGKGDEMKLDSDDGLGKAYFQGRAMEQMYDMHLSNSMKTMLFLLGEGEMKLADVMQRDIYGNLIFSHEKAHHLMDGPWKSIRYTFDQIFNYNKGVTVRGHDSEFENDGNGGRLERQISFKTQSLRDYMVSHEVSEMGMYDRKDYGYKVPGGEGSHEEDKLGRDVFAFLIAKEIESHTGSKRTKPYWSSDKILEMSRFFGNIFNEHNQPFYTAKEFRRMMKEAHTGFLQLTAKESTGSLIETLYAMIVETAKQAAK